MTIDETGMRFQAKDEGAGITSPTNKQKKESICGILSRVNNKRYTTHSAGEAR